MEENSVPAYLANISVVLCRTSHPANIGSAARAMKTMGLTRLILVAPDLMATPMTGKPPVFDATAQDEFRLPEESFVLASGAADVLEEAQVCATLEEALSPMVVSCALTSRRRELTSPLQTPRELVPELLALAADGQQVALVFGNETFGLSIEEVALCNRLLTISGNPHYFSLNLAQAVQVVCYEIFSQVGQEMTHLQAEHHWASHEQVEGMIAHMQEVMAEVGFFERRNEARLMRRVGGLMRRAAPEREDVDIIRGWCAAILRRLRD